MLKRRSKSLLCGVFVFCAAITLINLQTTWACESNALPAGIYNYLARNFPSWKVVRESDLLPEDRQIWLRRHAQDCPGFAKGMFEPGRGLIFAVAIIPKEATDHRTKLLVFAKRQGVYTAKILLEVPNGNPPVVFTVPPGTYESSDRGRRVRTKYPAIFYVHYETSTTLLYWSNGKYKELQVLD